MPVGLLSFGAPAYTAWPSQRSGFNLDFLATQQAGNTYPFIDHFRILNMAPISAPSGLAFNRKLDANGYPVNAMGSQTWGGSFYIPDSTNFSGTYIMTGLGSGNIVFNQGTWSTSSPVNVTVNSNGNYTMTATGSTPWSIVLTFTGTGTGLPQTIQWRCNSTDPSNAGDNLRAYKFYRSEDAADLAAGKIYRTQYKQDYVDLSPSFIRFMNWHGGNNAQVSRFEHRTLMTAASWSSNWNGSPAYGQTTGTQNAFVLDAASPTAGNAATTPVAMQHGEIVTCQFHLSLARGGAKTITADATGITKANPGVVTSAAHGYSDGDKVVFQITAGMTELDRVVATVTLDGGDPTNKFSIGIDTSGYTTFTAGTCCQYVAIDVGGRGEYPILWMDGNSHLAAFGSSFYLAANETKTLVFDKNSVGRSGVTGAWLFNGSGAAGSLGTLAAQMPIEACVALINEVNAMAAAQGKPHVDMWINMPVLGLSSMDSDYTADSDYNVNSMDLILNGGGGYERLLAPARVHVEYSNETWNQSSLAFSQAFYVGRRAQLRYSFVNTSNTYSFATLRTIIMASDLQAAFPNDDRIRYVMSGWNIFGMTPSTINNRRCFGEALLNADLTNPLNTIDGTGAAPITLFDVFATAPYYHETSAYRTANLATRATAWLAAIGNAAAQEAECATYLNGFHTVDTAGDGAILRMQAIAEEFAAALEPYGVYFANYEGGRDWSITAGANANENNFLFALSRSQAWADLQVDTLDFYSSVTSAAMPSIYKQAHDQFGSTYRDPYGIGFGGTAGVWGSGYAPFWVDIGTRNQALTP